MSIPQAESDPAEQACEERAEKVEKEIVDLRLLTIVSERRTVPAIMQVIRYWRNRRTTEKEEFKKAKEALVWTLVALFVPGGGSGGILTLLIAVATIYLGIQSNRIGTQSNDLITRQISVDDAARRANVSNELSAILDQVNNYQISYPQSRDLPSTIIARIKAATITMVPYEQPSIQPNGKPEFYSPERSQLLSALANLRLADYKEILEHVDFSYSKVSGLRLVNAITKRKARFSACQFSEATFESDTIVNSDFTFAVMEGGYIFGSNFSGSNFSGATLKKIQISYSTFNHCNFRGATLDSVTVDDYSIFKGSNFDGSTVDSAFFKDILNPLGVSIDNIKLITRPTKQ